MPYSFTFLFGHIYHGNNYKYGSYRDFNLSRILTHLFGSGFVALYCMYSFNNDTCHFVKSNLYS